MNAVIKVGFLILLASVVANAAPVQDDLVIAAAVDDASDDMHMHSSERRSSDVTRRIGLPWHLDRIDQRSSHLDGKYTPFANGTGVDIYMLADGIDIENEEFGGRAFDGKFNSPISCTEFGNSLASLAAGQYAGVAKNANIYSISLLTCRLSTTFAKVEKAVQHVIEAVKRTGRRSVLSIPLVGVRSHYFNSIVEDAVKENIVVVTSAGNSLRDACRYSPGSSPHVINVGATEMENGKDELHETFFYGTNYGNCVSLYAPGQPESSDYKKTTGTAQACAIVSGAAALVLEKYPHYTPAEVKQYLIDKATDGVINMDALRFFLGDKGTNKLLYVGNDDDDETSSGDYFDDTIGDDDMIDPLM